jgi:hypothetical protein
MPLATHWEVATCEDVDCPAWLNGWKTILPADSDLISVLKRAGRTYTEARAEGGMIEFTFAAGQPCFRASMHRQQTERPGLYIHGQENQGQRVVKEDEWQERFEETMDGLASSLNR